MPDSATLLSVRLLPMANSVLTPPGQIPPTLIPLSPSSRSSASVKPTGVNFVMPWTASPLNPQTPPIDQVVTIVPDFFPSITGPCAA